MWRVMHYRKVPVTSPDGGTMENDRIVRMLQEKEREMFRRYLIAERNCLVTNFDMGFGYMNAIKSESYKDDNTVNNSREKWLIFSCMLEELGIKSIIGDIDYRIQDDTIKYLNYAE